MRFDTSLSWPTPQVEEEEVVDVPLSGASPTFASIRTTPVSGVGRSLLPCRPKPFDVLHYLVTHPDRLVTKDTLFDAVWPELAISDVVVRVAIGELRRALGDTAQAPRFIATVHRRGYRFVAPVVEHTEGGPGPASPVPPVAPACACGAPTGCSVVTGGGTPPPHRAVLRSGRFDRTGRALGPGRPARGRARLPSDLCCGDSPVLTATLPSTSGTVCWSFGYPVAHEDDAQRAVRAGLGILRAMEPLNARLTLPPGDRLAVRLGIHTGLVVVGEVGPAPGRNSWRSARRPTWRLACKGWRHPIPW